MTSKHNLLIGITGSVASILIKEIINKGIEENKYNIKLILTEQSKKFIDNQTITSLKQQYKDIEVYDDQSESSFWLEEKKVLHIELRKWADIFLISPLSANSLSKIVNGICDNLLTCVVKAWDTKKTIVFGLAMNTLMYNNLITQEHLEIVKSKLGFIEVPVTCKVLKCGEFGKGSLANINDLYSVVNKELKQKKIFEYFIVKK